MPPGLQFDLKQIVRKICLAALVRVPDRRLPLSALSAKLKLFFKDTQPALEEKLAS